MSEELFPRTIDADALPEVEGVEDRDFEDELRERFEPFFEALGARETALEAETQVRWNVSDQYQIWFSHERAKLQAEVNILADQFQRAILGAGGTSVAAEIQTIFLRAVSTYKNNRLNPGVLHADDVLMEAGLNFHRATHDLLPFNSTRRLVRQVIEQGGQSAAL